MSDVSGPPEVVWNRVRDELISRSSVEGSGFAPMSQLQAAYLRQVTPVAFLQGFAVLTVPNQTAKESIENELGPSISALLSEVLGSPCALAVSVSKTSEQPSDPPPAASASSRPTDELYPVTQSVDSPTGTAPSPSSAPAASQYPQPSASPTQYSRPDTTANLPEFQPRPAQLRDYESTWDPRRSPSLADRGDSPSAQRLPRETPASNPAQHSRLSDRYTFDTFVSGKSNRFAHASAIAVAESPGEAFNPLFIWGGSGLGKTHLLHATGRYAKELKPWLKVTYVSSEEFTNDYINSVRDDRQESFKRRYREVDFLLVDDIQFLIGKEGTQEEFFHTFNALYQAGKQIMLSSDRSPAQLTTLTDRLRTRLSGGLITDIQPPDLETRIAILMKKAQNEATPIDRKVLELIASNFESSIRELEGALIRVVASASLNKEPVTLELAKNTLRDILPEESDVVITTGQIIEAVANKFGRSVKDIKGTNKSRPLAHARQLAMYLCRELTGLSLPKIGEAFGKDHTTVMYAHNKIVKEINENRETYDQIQELTQTIKLAARN